MAAWSGRDKEQLLEELRAGFLRLKGSQLPIRDGQPHLVPFCETLENILRVGLKQPGSILRVTRRDYWDWMEVLPTTTLCNAKKNPLLTAAVDTVRKSSVLKTPQGRGRCFLRMTLMQKLVPIPVEHLRKNPKLLSYWYNKDSIIHHEELASQLVHILFEVTELDFELNERASFLDETWIIPEYVKIELEPCERLGLKLVHMRDRVLVDGVVKGSVVDKSLIEPGDIVDELNGVRLFGVKVGQSQHLVSKHTGVINIVIVKSVMRDGTPFAPCQLRQVQVEAQRMQKAKNGTRKSSSVNQTDSPSPVDDVLRFDVVMLGMTDIRNPVKDGSIDDAIHHVLEGTGKPQAVLLSLERSHLVLCSNDTTFKALHKFQLSDVAACARGVVHRTCFGFAAGDCTSNDLQCYVFETPSDMKAKLVVQAMVAAFKRSTWFVPAPPLSDRESSTTPTSQKHSSTAGSRSSAALSAHRSPQRRSISTSPDSTPHAQRSLESLQRGGGAAADSPSVNFNRCASASALSSGLGSVIARSISKSSEHLCDPVLRRSWNQTFFGETAHDSASEDERDAESPPVFTDTSRDSLSDRRPSADGPAYSDFEVISDPDSPVLVPVPRRGSGTAVDQEGQAQPAATLHLDMPVTQDGQPLVIGVSSSPSSPEERLEALDVQDHDEPDCSEVPTLSPVSPEVETSRSEERAEDASDTTAVMSAAQEAAMSAELDIITPPGLHAAVSLEADMLA